jgi:hypothetical protein
MLMLSFINIYYGWDIFETKFGEDNMWIVRVGYGLTITIYVLLEVNHRIVLLFTDHWLFEFRTPNLPKMTHAQVMDLIFRQGKNLAFCNEYVIDLTWFKWSHPGGSVVFEAVRGEDLGKYMSGCSTTETTLNPYAHS